MFADSSGRKHNLSGIKKSTGLRPRKEIIPLYFTLVILNLKYCVCNFWLPKGRKKKAGKAGDLALFYQQTRRLKESIIAVFSSLFPSYRKVGARLLSEMQSEAAEK